MGDKPGIGAAVSSGGPLFWNAPRKGKRGGSPPATVNARFMGRRAPGGSTSPTRESGDRPWSLYQLVEVSGTTPKGDPMRCIVCVAVLAAFALPAYSQNEDSIVVTATRFPEDVRRLPASTTVLSADDIQKSAARTLPELLQEQVGITMKDFFGNNASNTSVDLRGFGVTGPQNTLILLDGRRITDIDLSSVQWAAIPLAGIERIEILPGTGAVLYGDGASAGVVNTLTRSPPQRAAALEA